MFTDFKFLLKRAVRRSGAADFVDEKTIFDGFFSFLREFFGNQAEEKFQIVDFNDGVISVASLCELNALNLKNKEQNIIDKLNEKLDKPLVRKINIIT